MSEIVKTIIRIKKFSFDFPTIIRIPLLMMKILIVLQTNYVAKNLKNFRILVTIQKGHVEG